MNEDIYYKLLCEPITSIYTDLFCDGNFYAPSDYSPLLSSFGAEILVKVDDANYSGDSRILYRRDDGQYGMLIFGWGSCSGCDALQRCESIEEVEELRLDLIRSIKWDTAKNLHAFIRDRDWDGEWSYHADETKLFVKEALAYLEKEM